MNTIINSLNLSTNALNSVRLNCIGVEGRKREKVDYIKFADSAVEAICLANWDANGDGKIQYSEASAVTDFKGVFKNNSAIKTFDELYRFDGLINMYELLYGSSVESAKITISNRATSIGRLLMMCRSLSYIQFVDCDTTNVSNFGDVFRNCEKIKSVDISSFRMTKCTSMWGMFYGCTKLESVKISQIKGSRASLFLNCSSLKDVEIERVADSSEGLSLSNSPLLTLQSVENIINALPEVSNSPSLTLHSSAIARYDAEYGEEACEDALLEKGWALAYA